VHTYSKEAIDRVERQRLHLKAPGYDTTAMSFIPGVPLNTPAAGNIRPLVKTSVKALVMIGMETVGLLGDAPCNSVAPPVVADGAEDPLVPLFHHGRHIQFLLEMLHQNKSEIVIDYAPGDGGMIKACLIKKIPCLAWFKNGTHKTVIEEELDSWLQACIADAANERFHRAAPSTED
jgi:hypothetical protein